MTAHGPSGAPCPTPPSRPADVFPAARPAPRPDGLIDVTIVDLELTHAPAWPHNPAPAGLRLALFRVRKPPLHYYRYLYDAVGGPWLWVDRKRLDDDLLRAIVHDDGVEISVLYCDGAPAGFVELDYRRLPEAVNIAYFGLVPERFGMGLGRYFLRWAIDEAWRRGPAKITVNTCNLDHAGALPLYQKSGFVPVGTRRVAFDPRLT